jgi:hypothetical protein
MSAADLPTAIVSQPQSKSVSIGANLSLFVTSTGTPPLSYQWQQNAIDLRGATNRSLSFTNVQLAQRVITV